MARKVISLASGLDLLAGDVFCLPVFLFAAAFLFAAGFFPVFADLLFAAIITSSSLNSHFSLPVHLAFSEGYYTTKIRSMQAIFPNKCFFCFE